jgi:hypothetical protein
MKGEKPMVHIPRPLVLDPAARAQARAYLARADRRMHWQWLFGVLVEGFWYLAIIAAGVATAIWIVGRGR